MATDSDELNPYRSPLALAEVPLICEVDSDPSSRLEVVLIKSATLYRRVRLSGRFSADIEWNANGLREFVVVNGQKVVSEPAYGKHIPRFLFEMYSNGSRHTVMVENFVTWIYFTKAFRVSIDGHVIYSEGDCSRLARLPNPYESPQAVGGQLTPGHPDFSGTLTRRSWTYRRIELHGKYSAVIEYNGRGLGYETVLVNGQVAARVFSHGIQFATPIEFEIQIGAVGLAGRIEIKTVGLLFLGAFRLLIDGYPVYCEGRF